MSNSGTWTSCFADFNKLPMPALRANRSLSSLMASTGWDWNFVCASGVSCRVGGRERMSMSIMIDDWRRSERSRGNEVRDGTGDRTDGEYEGRITDVGRVNDHPRTRSKARI